MSHLDQTTMPSRLVVQVAKSVEYVQAGVTHLQAAKQLQKNTRKWMCCALIVLLVSAVFFGRIFLSVARAVCGRFDL